MKESKIITFIGGYYIFGASILALSLISGNSQSFSAVFDLPEMSDTVIKLSVIAFFLPAGYLYLKRTRLGYWLILGSAVIFFCISATQTTKYNVQPYIGNMLYGLFVIVASIVRRREFTKSTTQLDTKSKKVKK